MFSKAIALFLCAAITTSVMATNNSDPNINEKNDSAKSPARVSSDNTANTQKLDGRSELSPSIPILENEMTENCDAFFSNTLIWSNILPYCDNLAALDTLLLPPTASAEVRLLFNNHTRSVFAQCKANPAMFSTMPIRTALWLLSRAHQQTLNELGTFFRANQLYIPLVMCEHLGLSGDPELLNSAEIRCIRQKKEDISQIREFYEGNLLTLLADRLPKHMQEKPQYDWTVRQLGVVPTVLVYVLNGADVNSRGTSKHTVGHENPTWPNPPIFNAIHEKNESLFDLLIAFNARPDIIDERGRSSIGLVVRYGSIHMLEGFLDSGVDPNLILLEDSFAKDTLLSEAALSHADRQDKINLLLKRGADIQSCAKKLAYAEYLDWRRWLSNRNGLEIDASSAQNRDVINFLVDKGMQEYSGDIFYLSEGEKQPFYNFLGFAVQRIAPSLVEMLLKRGANANVRQNNSLKSLHITPYLTALDLKNTLGNRVLEEDATAEEKASLIGILKICDLLEARFGAPKCLWEYEVRRLALLASSVEKTQQICRVLGMYKVDKLAELGNNTEVIEEMFHTESVEVFTQFVEDCLQFPSPEQPLFIRKYKGLRPSTDNILFMVKNRQRLIRYFQFEGY